MGGAFQRRGTSCLQAATVRKAALAWAAALALACTWQNAQAQDQPVGPLPPTGAEKRAEEDKDSAVQKPGREELPDVVVTGDREPEEDRYWIESGTTALKIDTPLLETPQMTTVVTRQLLEDQGADTFEDVWRNVPGAHSAFGEGAGGSVTLRGFTMTGTGTFGYPVMFNGLRGSAFGGWNPMRLYTLDRIEVLRGPAAVLYGSGAPAGVINYFSRKPQAEFAHTLDMTFGSYDLYRPHFHSTGPINESKSLLYMLDIGGENSDSFRKHVHKENLQLTAGLSWIPDDRTRVDFEFGFADDDRDGSYDRGVPFVNGKAFVLSNKFSTNEPSDFSNMTAFWGEAHFTRRFTDTLSLHSGLRVFSSEREYRSHSQFGLRYEPSTHVLIRSYSESDADQYGISEDTHLLHEIKGENIANKFLAGFEAFNDHQKFKGKTAASGVPGIDIYHPRYGLADPRTYTFRPASTTESDLLRFGPYAQDQVELFDRLHLMGGVRYDRYDTEQKIKPGATPKYSDDGGAVTMKGGILYELLDNLSVYGSYGQSYEPQSAPRTPQTRSFDPMQGWQVEAGVKNGWFDDRLTAQVAGFFIRQKNILVPDPVDPMRLVQIGEQESKGVEAELSGRITADLSLTANYAYTHAETTDDTNEIRKGQKLQHAAEHQGGAWLRYAFWDTGFAIFGGVTHVGKRLAWAAGASDPNHPYALPKYTCLDAGCSYVYKNLSVRAVVKNLLGEDIAVGGRSDGYMPGDPLSFLLTVKLVF